ncbi:MAG: PHB depolymerase family esterase [Rhodobacteraceae bacterium]|nr:PHB depolymerase family esterase [Paracoccaceae bacterium]
MISFNVGALRPANGAACPDYMSFANDLVRQTLARHGLAGDVAALPNGPAPHTMPLLEEMMARLRSPGPLSRAPMPELPEGAEFVSDHFECEAGSRRFMTYIPSTAAEGVSGIVLMLHGCTQTPEDFSVGTGMNALAEEHRFVVIYPHQSRGDNAQSCWNWFSRGDQRRDRGEPAILAGLTRQAMERYGVSREETFVAGLSAGAAMALILGETYPDVFAGVGAHSGLPYGAARDVPSAFAAMAGQEGNFTAPRSDTTPPPTIVFHGTADSLVHPSNGDRIARQVTDRAARETIITEESGTAGGRAFARTVTMRDDRTILLEQWQIDGLGHAWSGGNAAGSHTDPAGPDASAEMIRFFFETSAGAH